LWCMDQPNMINLRVFLEELSAKIQRCSVPMVFGCDFNLIRGRGDKNNSNIDWRLV
jgi:hypothetical protein